MSKIDTAIRMAAEVHEGQTDKSGEPYILHALSVMDGAAKIYDGYHLDGFARDDVLCAAVLHDVIEDYDGPASGLIHLRDRLYTAFGDRVYGALDCLTKQRGEEYESYIGRVESDWVARIVKIADLTHNMDPRRLPKGVISEVDFKRWDKYRRSLVRLREVETSTRKATA